MKLRNKKTGEIKNVNHNNILIHFNDGQTKCVHSIATLNEEWEDYEESKEYWCIDWGGTLKSIIVLDDIDESEEDKKAIGNYFKTKEEAEIALEKLKAWKRLKDAGFYFVYDAIKEGSEHKFILRLECEEAKRMKSMAEGESLYKDLKFLFGGEE